MIKWLILGILWHREVTRLYKGQQKLKIVTWRRPWEESPHYEEVKKLKQDGWYTWSCFY